MRGVVLDSDKMGLVGGGCLRVGVLTPCEIGVERCADPVDRSGIVFNLIQGYRPLEASLFSRERAIVYVFKSLVQ